MPHFVALSLVAGGVIFCLAPPADPDVWWHVRTGDLILDRRQLPTTDPWSLVGAGREWVAHSWLSEVALSLLHDAMGLKGLVAFRAVCVGILLTALAVQAFRRASPGRALLVTALAVFATRGGWGERPQLLSFLLLIPAAQLVRASLIGRRSIWWAVPLTFLWANLHGLWFLVPALVAMGALGAVEGADAGQRVRLARPYGLAAAACVIVAGLTPNGPKLLLQPLRVNGYGHFVSEWGPVDIHTPWGLGFFGMLIAFVVTYGRRTTKVAPHELLSVGFAIVLGLLYTRTVAPAAVLLAPLLAEAMGVARSRRPGFPHAFNIALVALLGSLAVSSAVVVLTQEPDLPPGAPVAATRALLAAVPRGTDPRVLDEYAIGGWLLLYAPKAHPAIDGRAEIYPASYVGDYIQALKLEGDWQSTITPLDANVALLHPETPLTNGLRDQLGWRTVFKDNTWVVLVPPAGAAS